MNETRDTRRIIRRVVGVPAAVGQVPARLPLFFERHRVLLDSIRLPPLPAPVLLVHTGGKPMSYRSPGRRKPGQSIPGLVTFVPRLVRAEAALRGVGEGTLVYFDGTGALPAWLLHSRYATPATLANDVIVSITRRLMHEIETDTGGKAHLRALGNALVAELQRELTRPETAVLAMASRSELRVAQAAIRHMQAHLGESLPVVELARVCGVGVTSFAKGFREATGVPPHRYLRRIRIERACELLRTTGLSVREVAEVVGFRGQGHFCAAFVSGLGLTPTGYRRATRRQARPT